MQSAAFASAAQPEFVAAPGEAFPITMNAENKNGSYRIEENGGGHLFTCPTSVAKLTITGANTFSPIIELKGCKGGATSYNSEGAPAGVVVLSAKKSSLAYLNKAKHEVGIVFEVNKTRIGGFALIGTMVLPITPTNTLTTKYQLAVNPPFGGGEYFYEGEKGERVEPELFFNGISSALQAGVLNLQASKSLKISA
jgi:hypothetical protein